MSTSSLPRVALLGAGGIAAAHARGYVEHAASIKITALCDVSAASLTQRKAELGGDIVCSNDWRVMLRDAGDLFDAVDICLPHQFHADAILDCAAAGKHILCEKPMCTSLAHADRIAAAVEKAGVIYMAAHNQLFMPAIQEAKKMIEAGAIGEVRWARSQDAFRAPSGGFAGKWRANLKLQGGGELIDTGYHPTYRLLHLVGSEIVGIRGSMGRYEHAIEGEDSASVQVRFASGAIGEIMSSWAYPQPYGTHQIHLIGAEGEIFGSNSDLYHRPSGWSEPAKRTFPKTDTFVAQIGHFAKVLSGEAEPPHSVKEARAVLEVILKAAKDAEGWQKYAPLQLS